jgi:branched-chain amino acid transport system permease protein
VADPNRGRARPAIELRPTILLAVAAVAFLVVCVGPVFLDRFTLNVLTRSMIYALLAVTVDLLWGYTGILTFGQAAFFGIGAYATAMIATHVGDGPVFMALGIALAILVPMVIGIVVGWLSFYNGSTPLYASVVSLVFPIVVTQLVFSGGTLTGSSSGLVGYATLPLGFAGFFRLAGLCLIAVTLAAAIFVCSEAGRILIAIRDNEMRCAYLGLDTPRIKIALTSVLAGVAGLAGFLYAHASGVVAPECTSFVFGTELVVWTALGGRATILGPVLGTIGIDYLSANLSGELPFLYQLIIGALFVVMILVMPNGLATFASRFVRLAGSSPTRVAESADAPANSGGARTAAGEELIRIAGLGKSYGSQHVLRGIDLIVRPGELVSLVGPNGAGKTTLMRCISDGTLDMTGMTQVCGRSIAGLVPNEIVALGVGRKFQVASVFESLTVGESLRMARSALDAPSRFRSSEVLELPPPAVRIVRLTSLDHLLDAPVSRLSHGQKQSLELAMVVALAPKLILLDEPTAGLAKPERSMIGGILKTLTADLGVAAILVEHDLDFVRDISSRIVVLHQGRLVLDGSVDEVVSSDLVRTIYSGGAHA